MYISLSLANNLSVALHEGQTLHTALLLLLLASETGYIQLNFSAKCAGFVRQIWPLRVM